MYFFVNTVLSEQWAIKYSYVCFVYSKQYMTKIYLDVS